MDALRPAAGEEAEIEARFFLWSFLLYDRLDLHFGTFRGIADHCGTGGADKIFSKGITPFGEG